MTPGVKRGHSPEICGEGVEPPISLFASVSRESEMPPDMIGAEKMPQKGREGRREGGKRGGRKSHRLAGVRRRGLF